MLEKIILKNILLEKKLCIENVYLDLYIDLLYNSKGLKRQKFTTERHHIIPKFYFKKNDLACDNTDNNLVNLSYVDHMKAHMYLALCVSGKYKGVAAFAAHRLITGHQGMYHNIEDIIDILDYESLANFKTLLREQISLASSNRKNNLNKIWIFNEKLNKSKLVDPNEVKDFLDQGWIKTRQFKQSEEAKEKNRIAHKGKVQSEEAIFKLKSSQAKAISEGRWDPHRKLSEDTKKKISEASKLQFKDTDHVNKGKICVHDEKTLTNKYIKIEDLDTYLNNGYIKGNGNKNTRMKKVICIDTGGIYESASYVAKMLGVVDMSLTCKNFKTKGKCNKAKGFSWAYLEDWNNLTQEEKIAYKNKQKKNLDIIRAENK